MGKWTFPIILFSSIEFLRNDENKKKRERERERATERGKKDERNEKR